MPSPTAKTDAWFKSSFSSNANNCVEVRFHGGSVSIRDSKYRRNPSNDPRREPIITVTAAQWRTWLDELIGRGANGALAVETTADSHILQVVGSASTLHFTATEWEMFLAGVRAHEFDQPEVVATAS
ncbi:MAG: DUF397 domain-containing protein [Sciscionella sp.]